MAVVEHGEHLVGQDEETERLDPGAPFTHSLQEEVEAAVADKGDKADKPDTAAADKAASDARYDSIQRQLDDVKAESARNRRDAEYWADVAKRGVRTDDTEAEQVTPENAADFLDDVSTLGAEALAKRGFIKASDVERMIDSKIAKTVDEVQSGNQFDAMLNEQFPELKNEQSDMFKRTQVHFADMVAIDPAARGARVTLLAAAKMAKAEITAKAAEDARNDTGRRDRIEQQRGPTGRTEERPTNELRHSPLAATIAGRLGRFIDKDPSKVMGKVAQFGDARAGRKARESA